MPIMPMCQSFENKTIALSLLLEAFHISSASAKVSEHICCLSLLKFSSEIIAISISCLFSEIITLTAASTVSILPDAFILGAIVNATCSAVSPLSVPTPATSSILFRP